MPPKKLEASRRSVRSDVDFVVTFEELQAMFDAKGIDLSTYEAESSFHNATGAGRGYACAGGVAAAIEKCINKYYPDVQVNIEHAEGLADCKKILTLAKAGKLNGLSDRGMGCPGRLYRRCRHQHTGCKSKEKPAELCKQIKPCGTSGRTHRDRSGITVPPGGKATYTNYTGRTHFLRPLYKCIRL